MIVRRRNVYHSSEESSVLSAEDNIRIQPKEIVDVLVLKQNRRREVLQETSLDSDLLSRVH
jgi:hypothetical protein